MYKHVIIGVVIGMDGGVEINFYSKKLLTTPQKTNGYTPWN